ncbi:complement factor H-related protein 4-like [Caloenas nicobarica]|uniref:complement factor H-related protein 4-like n=1 Tax=Caloenas nicobarica TaxID=187106 RepID=UPI0032B75A97
MALLSCTVVFLLWVGCAAHEGTACEDPPLIDFGEIISQNKSGYMERDRVQYMCNTGYTLSGSEWVTCHEKIWVPGPPQCLAPCIITKQQLEVKNLLLSNGQRHSFLIQSETICDVPEIPHGYVHSPKETYKESEQLQFACDEGYRYGERADVRCTESGWDPTPYCTEIVCSPPRILYGNFTPQGDNYVVGDIITVECNPGYYFKTTTGKTTAECTKNGWVPDPGCVEKPCDYPVIENGRLSDSLEYYRNYYFPMRFGQHADYRCNNGYSTPSGRSWVQVVCSERGWSPEPKCLKNCRIGHLENGYFSHNMKNIYKEGERVKYVCNGEYYTEHENGEVTCTKDDWSPPPRCIRKKQCQSIYFDNGYFTLQKETFHLQEKVTYSCLPGFVTPEGQERGVIQCQENGWTPPPKCIIADIYLAGARLKYVSHSGYVLEGPSEITCSLGNWTTAPTCLGMPCGGIPKVANAQIEGRNKATYEPGETIRYQCDEGFLLVGPPEIICREGNWTAPPFCEDVTCGAAPEIPNAYIASSQQERYPPGARVQYECESNFQMMDINYVTCRNGQWSQAPTCRDVTCQPPPEIAGGKIEGIKKSRYLPGESAHYQCWRGFQMTGSSRVTCQNGNWTEMPKCKGEGGKCGPPPVIENGDLLSFPMQEYPQGTTLEYKCPSLYVLEGSQYITCADGQWTSPPVCLVACTISEEDMSSNNIELKWFRGRKLYSTSGDFIELKCRRGYVKDPASSPFRVQCVEGTLEYPRCKPGRNCVLDKRTMEGNNIQLRSSRSSSTSTYRSGDYIDFECKRWYQKVSRAESLRAECLDGVIQYPTCEAMFG